MMNADIYIPSENQVQEDMAFSRTTHLAIGAHQDDVEIIGFEGVSHCYKETEKWFSGIVLTDGGGSVREGKYKDYTDEQMKQVRKQEQYTAADLGQYSIMIQCGLPSHVLKEGLNQDLINQLLEWLLHMKPQVVYLHNLLDRHATHIATSVHALEALRLLPEQDRPEKVYGVEVWRGLDWLSAQHKIELDVSHNAALFDALINVFESQNVGGKRYDLAAGARQQMNATFGDSHSLDIAQRVILAMNLKPLLEDTALSYQAYVAPLLEDFNNEVTELLTPYKSRV